MALPPVNIPNVNYGSYARPEQVKVDVRGQMAIGQAIAQGFQAAANYVNQKAEANRKLEQEAAKETKQDTKELATEFKTANALQNTNVLREISADLADINMQATKDPSLNFTLEKQNMFGIVDNINILENDILDKLPEDLTRNDFVNRDAWEKYSSLLKLKNNETPLEYDKNNKDLIVYINGKKNNLRDLMDKKGALDYTSGLRYKIENNPTIDNLGSEFNEIAENYVKVENGVKKLDYNRAAAVIGDFPLIKDIVREFGENIYDGYLKGEGEPYDPTNKDQLAEVQTLIIDRALANVPKDFGDAPPVPEEKPEKITAQMIREAEAAESIATIDEISATENFFPLEEIEVEIVVEKGGWFKPDKTKIEKIKQPFNVLEGDGFISFSKKLAKVGFNIEPIQGEGENEEGKDDRVNIGAKITSAKTGKSITLYGLDTYTEQEFRDTLKRLASQGTVTGLTEGQTEGEIEEDIPPIINQ